MRSDYPWPGGGRMLESQSWNDYCSDRTDRVFVEFNNNNNNNTPEARTDDILYVCRWEPRDAPMFYAPKYASFVRGEREPKMWEVFLSHDH